MAGLNGTGPNGIGPMTGRGLGYCNPDSRGSGKFRVTQSRRMGMGIGRGRGQGRGRMMDKMFVPDWGGFGESSIPETLTEKETLERQSKWLKDQQDLVQNRLMALAEKGDD